MSARARRWPAVLVVAGFAILFAWDVWEAVQNLVVLPAFAQRLGLTAAQVPWWLLVLDVILPVAGFVVALVVGRRRGTAQRALVLLVALAVVAAWSLLLTALAPVAMAALL